MSETREFPSLAVGSAALGIALRDGLTYSDVQEISEHVLGHPVWTHEIPSTGPEVDRRIREQFPLMPTREDARADWQATAAKITAAYGKTMTVKRGNQKRARDPISTAVDMMGGPSKVIVVSTGAKP